VIALLPSDRKIVPPCHLLRFAIYISWSLFELTAEDILHLACVHNISSFFFFFIDLCFRMPLACTPSCSQGSKSFQHRNPEDIERSAIGRRSVQIQSRRLERLRGMR
jgi:hypothetical protein